MKKDMRRPNAPKTRKSKTPSLEPGKVKPEVVEELLACQHQTYSGVILLQLDAAYDVPEEDDLLSIAQAGKLEELACVLGELKGARTRRLFEGALLKEVRQLESEVYGVKKNKPRPSLTAYWRIDLRKERADPEATVSRLAKSTGVNEVYREFAARPATLPDCPPSTLLAARHEFTQRYLCPAPMGIDVREAWNKSKGQGRRVIDVEIGWALPHEDLPSEKIRLVSGDIIPVKQNLHHGAAVLGILAATHDGKGVSGIVPEVEWIGCASTYHRADQTVTNIARAIVEATLASQPGDVILVEMERNHFMGNGVPVQIDSTDWLAIALAVASGRVVIEAAGNAILDLKNLELGGDTGAIMVGGCGGCADPSGRTYASNYGKSVDCFAWGASVETCGYGDAQGTSANDFYTAKFGGSSAASAIIAGAAVLVQSIASKPLAPAVLRDYFSKLGTPQVTMGVMPDLRQILQKI